MKNIIIKLAGVCVLSLLFAASCKKNKDSDPLEQLPPETQTGANTFGCLINGKVFKPQNNGSLTPTLSCYYQHIYPTSTGFVFNISAIDKKSSPLRSVSLTIDSVKLNAGMELELGGSNSRAGARCDNGNVIFEYVYYTVKGYTGKIILTKFDEANQIASGTFWFKAVNSFGDTVNVTNGRFDMKYTR